MCKTCEQFAEKVCVSCDNSYTENQIFINCPTGCVDVGEVISKQSITTPQNNPQFFYHSTSVLTRFMPSFHRAYYILRLNKERF